MSRVEEMTAVAVSVPQAIRTLTTTARFPEWVAPHITVTPRTAAPTLGPGDRFAVELLGRIRFEYQVEAISDREVVFSFTGPWNGRERWSFVADGAETIVRRVHEVDEGSLASVLAWSALGRPLVIAHFKLELWRFRELAERDPGPRAEIPPSAGDTRGAHTDPSSSGGGRGFPVDDA